MYGLERLEEAAVKVWNGVDFSQAETAQIKKEFRVLRKRCLNALSAITIDEVRSQSPRHWGSWSVVYPLRSGC